MSSGPFPARLPLVLALAAACAPAVQAQSSSESVSPGAPDATQALAPVTVTARRRDENVQDVPIPATVLDGEALERQHVQRVEDLQQLLPSTTVGHINARQTNIAVRGIGNNPANDGLEASTGVYLDNVHLGRPGMAVFDMLDVEQIELLRGPQGTLFGKNTTAGLLNISTRKPTFEPEHSVQVSVGQRGYLQTQGVLSGPVSDDSAARLLVYQTEDDGSVRNIHTGERLNGGTRTGLRAQWLYQPDAAFSLRLIGDYHAERSSYGTQVLYSMGPGLAAQRALAAGATNVFADPRRYQVNLDDRQHVSVDQGGLSAEANWQLASGFKLTAITAARFWNYSPDNDDNLNVPVTRNVGFNVRDQQFSQEVRLASPTGGPVDYVVGAYYFHQRVRNESFVEFGRVADIALNGSPLPILAGASSRTFGDADTDSYALFSQATWHATERLDLTGGLRATYEEKRATLRRAAPVGGDPRFAAYRNLPGVAGAYDSGSIGLNDWSPSALLSASYRLQPGMLGYLSYSHGEKSGGVNLGGVGAAPQLGPDSLRVGSEKVDSVDLGVKNTLADGRVQLNANVFWAGVKGYQATQLVPQPGLPGAFVQTLTNAGDVRSRGVEIDLKAAVARGVTVFGNASFNDARYQDYRNAPCPPEVSLTGGALCDITGRQVAGAPRWIVNLGAEYRFPLSPDVQQYVSASYAWRSEQDGTLDGSIYSRIPSYGVFNLATGWDMTQGDGLWSLSLWVRNVFDKRYFPAVVATASGAYTASVGTPRTIGATLRYAF